MLPNCPKLAETLSPELIGIGSHTCPGCYKLTFFDGDVQRGCLIDKPHQRGSGVAQHIRPFAIKPVFVCDVRHHCMFSKVQFPPDIGGLRPSIN